MKTQRIIYWILTGLFGLLMLFSGFSQATHQPQMVEGLAKLHYPEYLLSILGPLKILGVAALLIPHRFSHIKVAAYAGFLFLLTGAMFSHIASNDEASHTFTTLLLALVDLASYFLWRRVYAPARN